jgi:hypothetical protein
MFLGIAGTQLASSADSADRCGNVSKALFSSAIFRRIGIVLYYKSLIPPPARGKAEIPIF